MILPLTEDMYDTILSLYKKAKGKREANYLNLLLLKHKGYSQVEIADILHLDADTVCTWVKKFKESQTLEEYLRLDYTSYAGKLPYADLAKVDNLVENGTYCEVKPIISAVKEQFEVEYSLSGMTKLLRRLGFSHKQKVALPSKLDTQKQADFVAEYETIRKNLGENSAIFFMDAVHPQHNTHTLKAWLRKGKPSYILSNNGRNRLNINGLYNPLTQEVIVTYHKTINAQAAIETFEELQKRHADKALIYVFADNARYYVSQVLKEYLAQNPKIKLVHLPPYSPNLNFIERLWKYLRKKVINANYFEKFEQFSAAIKTFFDNIADNAAEIAQFIGTKFRLFDLA